MVFQPASATDREPLAPLQREGARRAVQRTTAVVNTERASQQYYIDVLNEVLKRLGWKNVRGAPGPDVDIVWSEDPVKKPRLLALPRGARTNRFSAMVRICRKVCLAHLIDACERLHPDEFSGLSPQTWWVGKSDAWAGQLAAHRDHCTSHAADKGPPSAYIVKPDNGCQGAGITLVRGHDELVALIRSAEGPERAVVQTYMPNPLLVDGLKFDLRLYVVITCASPLQAFLSTHGVARFASHAWAPVDESNQGDLLMHLSNSSINQVASGVSNKWALPRLWERLARDGTDVESVRANIHRLVARTLAAMQPAIAHAYTTAFSVGFTPRRAKNEAPSHPPGGAVEDPTDPTGTPAAGAKAMGGQAKASASLAHVARVAKPTERRCFQILGLDVMLDSAHRPWLLEVSFEALLPNSYRPRLTRAHPSSPGLTGPRLTPSPELTRAHLA